MNKFMNVLEKYLTPFSQMVASNQLLQSIKDAFRNSIYSCRVNLWFN